MAEPVELRLEKLAARRASASAPDRGHWDLADIGLAVRWGATSIAVITVFARTHPSVGTSYGRDVIGAAVIVVFGVARTLWPVGSDASERRVVLSSALDVGLATILALATGAWSSPLLIMVGCSLLIAGLLGGYRSLLVCFGLVLVLVAVAELAGSIEWFREVRSSIAAQRIPELFVMGLVGAYANRVFYSHQGRYNRLRWLNEVHALLFELYTLAAEHPGVFTVEGVVHAAVARLREVLSSDVVVVLLRHPSVEDDPLPWEVAYAEGAAVATPMGDADLPQPLHASAEVREVVLREHGARRASLHPEAFSSLYAPIIARGALVGLLVLERLQPPAFTVDDKDVIEEIARHTGLAIENARSFARLRTLGAEEERERIARELHDHVGQSLAAIAFNIDRILASMPAGATSVSAELGAVSTEVRTVNAQIREKLGELRSGPNTSLDLVRLLDEYLGRVELRSKMRVNFAHELDDRLPDITEREIWRIACEAIRNAERHSGAQHLVVGIRREDDVVVLEVHDDGNGIERRELARHDAFGLIGMRERADLIGATLALESTPQDGTTVRLRVPCE